MILKFVVFSIALILSIILFFLTLKYARDKEKYRVRLAKYSSDVEDFYKELSELANHYISFSAIESFKAKWKVSAI